MINEGRRSVLQAPDCETANANFIFCLKKKAHSSILFCQSLLKKTCKNTWITTSPLRCIQTKYNLYTKIVTNPETREFSLQFKNCRNRLNNILNQSYVN